MTNTVAQSLPSVAQRMEAAQHFVLEHVSNSQHWSILPYVSVQLPAWMNVHAMMMLVSATILTVAAVVAARRKDPVPTGLANFMETIVVFVRDQIAVPALGTEDGVRMTPIFCTFFTFILTINIIGLLPCFPVATGNLAVTGALACVTLVFMTFGAMARRGPMNFLKALVPHGVPWWVGIILFPIELLGIFIKAFALTIRLFANMLAGHMVLLTLISLVVVFGVTAIPTIFMAVGIYVLEVGIALLQAYIFTALSAIFIGQQYHPQH